MEPIAELPLVGGDLAIDLVNTVEDRSGTRVEDALRSPADLAAWGARAGVYGGSRRPAGVAAEKELEAVVALREHIFELLDARLVGRPPRRAALRGLAAEVVAAYDAATLAPGADGALAWQWDPRDLATVRHRVAVAAAALLGGPALDRLGRCEGDHCGWLFLDTSKRGNRRWCSMSSCGQEAKSAGRRRRGAAARARA